MNAERSDPPSPGRGTCLVPTAGSNGWMRISVAASPNSSGLARIKGGSGTQAIGPRLREVLELAQLADGFDARWRSVVEIHPAPAPGDRRWELAVVLADRLARGTLKPPQQRLVALGASDAWESGRLCPVDRLAFDDGLAALIAADLRDACVVVAAGPDGVNDSRLDELAAPGTCGDLHVVSTLGGIDGRPDPGAAMRTARAWFPAIASHSPTPDDRLLHVDVTVRPRAERQELHEEPIVVTGVHNPPERRAQIARVLEASRSIHDAAGEWATAVRFDRDFSDRSHELALVVADQIARGVEVLPRSPGRLIATGAWMQGTRGLVFDAEGMTAKCALLLREARPGDRVLLPARTRDSIDPAFLREMRARQVSLALVNHIE